MIYREESMLLFELKICSNARQTAQCMEPRVSTTRDATCWSSHKSVSSWVWRIFRQDAHNSVQNEAHRMCSLAWPQLFADGEAEPCGSHR